MYGSLSAALGEEITPQTPADLLRKHADERGLETDPKLGHGKLVEELWEHLVGDHLHAPTFVRDFPVETSPLTREHRDTPGVAEKWDLYVRGFELATGYSELVDPVVERQRLTEQARLGAAGDDEAMPARRGLSACDGVRNATEWWRRNGHRSAADGAHRSRYPGDDPLPTRATRMRSFGGCH